MALGVAGKTKIEVDTGTIADGDSIASYVTDSAGTLITSTLVGSKQSLDVNVANLEQTEDSGHTTGDVGVMGLAVRNDAGTALAGTDLDYIPLSTDSSGNLRTTTSLTAEFAEDSAHTTGENVLAVGAVREDDSVSNVGAEGDYSNIQTWSEGSVRVVDNANGTNLQQVVTAGLTAVQLPATNLANRKMLMIQNVSNKILWVGSSTVTADETATGGIQIGKGGFITLEAGPANDIYGISDTASQPIAVLELS